MAMLARFVKCVSSYRNPPAGCIPPVTGVLRALTRPPSARGLSPSLVCCLVFWLTTPLLAQESGICQRTLEVRNAIVAASGAATCAQVTQRHLREIAALDLSDQWITTLRAEDFDGLVRLDLLDLSGNLLTSLPEGVFDDLYLLKTLKLDGNLLTTLRADVFEELFLLEELTLNGNRFASLPAGLFPEFSRFDGMGANGDPPDNSGSYPRIQRFLDRHEVESPEDFVAALPTLYKQHFAMMYRSESPAQAHVSGDHPRVISWGPDGRFIFAWTTDESTPARMRESVEFLRQNDLDWTAGVIDFNGATPEITEPAGCQSCHGSTNKPLWGEWFEWSGSEFAISPRSSNYESAAASTKKAIASTDPRIEPLDFSASTFEMHQAARVLVRPGRVPHLLVGEEAGAVWSWRHAEVLVRKLRARYPNFREFSGRVMCLDTESAFMFAVTVDEFSQIDHNLFASAADPTLSRDPGQIMPSPSSALVSESYHYNDLGSVASAMVFLVAADLWRQEPMVRHLYRNVSNEHTLLPTTDPGVRVGLLYYDSGSATAEDELIQKLRIHFGEGGAAALDARAYQNERVYLYGVLSASFYDAHVGMMGPGICSALTESAPGGLRVTLESGRPVLTWDAPTYDAEALTGYRILRGVGGRSREVYVADTGSTNTTWTDDDAPTGDVVYVVKTLYDSYYASPSSDEVATTVEASPIPVLAGPEAFTVAEGDTAVATLMATDEDTPAADLVWSLSGGVDQSSFALTSGGDLTFAAAKDFEAPDDADGDGTYTLTVTVSDGTNSSSADITVMLSNRNEEPTADAGADQADVDGGTTVTLSGTGEDPDSNDTLTYAWTQTSGTAVTLSAASAAATSFTAPSDLSADETLRFTLRVTDATGLYAEDEVAVTVAAAATPLTARVEGVPTRHDGSSAFTFELHFSEEMPLLSYVTLRDSAFQMTGGAVRNARRQSPPSNVSWYIDVAPASNSEAVLVLPANRACDATGAICTEDGRRLSNRLEIRVPGPLAAPAVTGSTTFTVVEGETAVGTLTATDADTAAADLTWSLTGGADQGRFTLSSAGVLAFAAAKDFESPDDADGDGTYAVVAQVSDGGRTASADITVTLSNRNEAPTANAGADHDVEGGATVTLSGTGVDPDAGDTLTYAWTQTAGTTVSLSSSSAAAPSFSAPSDLSAEETLRFTLRVTDGGGLYAENEVAVTVAAASLTASAEGVPARHDGSSVFTFELHFSEEVPLSYVTLRDSAFQATGATVRNARRQSPPSNVSWYIDVQPESNASVVLVLPANRACDATGAICTAGGRQLFNRLTVTVPGP